MFSVFLATVHVQGQPQVAGPQGAAKVGEGGWRTLAGWVTGEGQKRPGPFCCGLVAVVPGERDEVLRVTGRSLIASFRSRSWAVSSWIQTSACSRASI